MKWLCKIFGHKLIYPMPNKIIYINGYFLIADKCDRCGRIERFWNTEKELGFKGASNE